MLIDIVRGLNKQAEECCPRSAFAELLMLTVSTAHLWHFKTKSFAQHTAFGDFYTGLNDLADNYIEADMGVNGLITDTGNSHAYLPLASAIEALKVFKESIKSMRDMQESSGNNGLVAILEEIMSLTDSTLYKLTYLN